MFFHLQVNYLLPVRRDKPTGVEGSTADISGDDDDDLQSLSSLVIADPVRSPSKHQPSEGELTHHGVDF